MAGVSTRTLMFPLLGLGLMLLAPPARSQAPTGSTGQCKDGSYTTAAKKWQACNGHKGVQSWFADAQGAATSAPATGAPPAVAGTSTGAAAKSPAATTAAAKSTTSASAPGGGPGMVWLNSGTKIYHCPGGAFYGKTKDGKYMSEADAKKAGARPDHNRPCKT